MSQVLHIKPEQEFVYRVDILKVFKGGAYDRWNTYTRVEGERERLETPELIETAFHNTPRAARNYGSYRTGRAKWYNALGATEHWDYAQRKYVKPDQGVEPNLDYKVYKISLAVALGDAQEIPQLKRMYELD